MAHTADTQYDMIVVGSGAASVISALVAKASSKRVVVIEKNAQLGGSTALSGGVVWVPNNPVMERQGVNDSPAQALAYLEACAGNGGKGATDARRKAFLDNGPAAIGFLEDHGMRFRRCEGYADYHETEYPGGSARGRTLVAKPFNLKRLNGWRDLILRAPGEHIPIAVAETRHIIRRGVTLQDKLMYLKMAWRLAQRKFGIDLVARGLALQGRLLKIAMDQGIEFRLNSGVTNILRNANNAVTGVEVRHCEETQILEAPAVLLNAGGFAHNAELRQRYGPHPSSTKFSIANSGDTGEILEAVKAMGGDVDNLDLAWWLPTSIDPDGGVHFHNPMGISKPHTILVDGKGERYVNEATSYVAIGIAMFERHKQAPAVPSWVIQDANHRQKYRDGALPAGAPPERWVEQGYIKQADTIEALADECGLPPAKLRSTVDRFNGFARNGIDEDFGKGKSAYHDFLGDPTHKPNSNLGAIEKPPFYAIAVYPGDVGTAGGLVTDEFSRVLKEDGSAIPGLYATGNLTASVLGRSYPGAGASIGASMVFGYVAARHALGANSLK